MIASRAALLLVAALVASCATTPQPVAAPVAEESVEVRLRAVRASLDAARAAKDDFGATARHLQEAREEMLHLLPLVEDPDRRGESGFDAMAMEVEGVRRALLQERLPAEVYGFLRLVVNERARSTRNFEMAKSWCSREAPKELFVHLVSMFSPVQMSDWDPLLVEVATTLTDEERGRHDRLVQLRKSLRLELMDYWQNRDKSGGLVTSYGSGTFVVYGSRDRAALSPPTPDSWWEDAPASERAEWLLSWIAEQSELFEVSRTWDDPCAKCEGRGASRANDANPSMLVGTICAACGGCGKIRKVRWR